MKKILIDASGEDSWIGGLYYKKNILFSILQNKNIFENYSIILAIDKKIEIFEEFNKNVKIIRIHNRLRRLKLLLLCKIMNVKFYYPYLYNNGDEMFERLGITIIKWIPDFQHKYYSKFFTKDELNIRDKQYQKISDKKQSLVLSSNSSLIDYYKFYGNGNNHVFVIPFVSYIEKEISSLTLEYEKRILLKYSLNKRKFVCIMNQFWQHKNHIIVLKAMDYFFTKNPESDIIFVFTGKVDDYRNTKYIMKIKELFEDIIIKKHSKLLGFIDRTEQLVLMKNAEYIIQPSLFEGWGTVVEDAKVLDKTILLSDIPIHREQMNHKCILFDPNNSVILAHLIEEESKKQHNDDINAGIKDMYKRAKEYSLGFEKLLNEI